MQGGCLSEQTNWRLKLEISLHQCEGEAYADTATEATLTAKTSQAAHVHASPPLYL